ncbi:PR-1-like protein, partial [Didymella exigua CBS 183.55]
TSKPAVVPSSSKPVLAPSTTPVPSTGGRITGTAQAYLSIGLAYQAAILYHHNAARANHGAPPLIWDSSCEANARAAANTCTYARYVPAGVSQGQNRYLSTSDGFNVTAAITESWYKNQFSSVAPWFGIATLPVSLLASVDQLTQVLWKGTSRVGCASVDCGTRMSGGGATAASNKYTVCNYAAAGNVGGLFAINVGRPLSTTALGRWTD